MLLSREMGGWIVGKSLGEGHSSFQRFSRFDNWKQGEPIWVGRIRLEGSAIVYHLKWKSRITSYIREWMKELITSTRSSRSRLNSSRVLQKNPIVQLGSISSKSSLRGHWQWKLWNHSHLFPNSLIPSFLSSYFYRKVFRISVDVLLTEVWIQVYEMMCVPSDEVHRMFRSPTHDPQTVT